MRPDGGLDMASLLAAFQDFFRQNSEHWIRRAQYTEAGPQLVLQAFLHRVSERQVPNRSGNTRWGSRRGGSADRLAAGKREGEDRIVVECKLAKEGPLRSRERSREGLEETKRYMDISGTDAGHLVVFDMRPGRSWAERIFRERARPSGCPDHRLGGLTD